MSERRIDEYRILFNCPKCGKEMEFSYPHFTWFHSHTSICCNQTYSPLFFKGDIIVRGWKFSKKRGWYQPQVKNEK